MNITHIEFFRLLPKALKTQQYKVTNNIVCVPIANGGVTITLSDEIPHTMGALEMTMTAINYQFEAMTEGQVRQFMRQFDISFQKGGG